MTDGLRTNGVSPSVAVPSIAGTSSGDGQEVDHRVEHRLNALVLEGGAAQHRVELARDGGATDRGLEVVDRDLLTLEVALHDLVVDLGKRLEQLLAILGGLVRQLGGNLLDRVVVALLGLTAPGQRPHAQQIHDADVVALEPDRDLQHERCRVEPGDHHLARSGRSPRRSGPAC